MPMELHHLFDEVPGSNPGGSNMRGHSSMDRARRFIKTLSSHSFVMVMGMEDFIKDALEKPNDYIAYHIGRELAELHPGKAIIEGDTGSFDLEAFVRAEQCSIVHETSLFNHTKTEWMGHGKRLRRSIENAWTNVLWQGHLLDVV